MEFLDTCCLESSIFCRPLFVQSIMVNSLVHIGIGCLEDFCSIYEHDGVGGLLMGTGKWERK